VLGGQSTPFSAGVPSVNSLVFLPWTFFGLLTTLLCVHSFFYELTLFSAVCEFVLCFALVVGWALKLKLRVFIDQVLLSSASKNAIAYMALLLIFALPALYRLNKTSRFSKLTTRKLYHLLSFTLFTPPLFFADQSKSLTRMMVFAFNCVTVLLIFVEVYRSKSNPTNFLTSEIDNTFRPSVTVERVNIDLS
jgi:hypothetical protein